MRQSLKIAAPCLALCHSLLSHGLTFGQMKKATASTATAISGTSTGCAVKKLPDSSAGVPFETVCGRKMPTPSTSSALAAMKKSDCTTVADVTPATDAPGMLVRKMPIIAAVPA